MKRFLLPTVFVFLLFTSTKLFAQFDTPTVNGTIAASEYGTHTDGNNQQTSSGSVVTYMTWDATNLYVGVEAANTSEAFVIYFDKDNLTPIDSGTNTNGTIVGNAYDGTNFDGLPFRADIVMYVKSGYREFRTADGAGGWSAATTGFGAYAETGGNVREFSIPWTSFPGGVKPTAFNWFSYVTSSGGVVYGQVPTANAGDTIGTTARYERYFTVTSTVDTSSTKPMSRDCFVFNNTTDENTFGAISVFDFTMNSTGRQIARVTGNWTIDGTLRVNAGSIYYGSGGTYGNSTVAAGVVSGGLLDIDLNNQTQTFTNTLSVSGGTFNMGNSGNSVAVATAIATVGTAVTVSGGEANISNGTLSIGVTGGGNQALNLSGGILNLTNGGTINLNGNFTRPTAGGQFNQSGTSLLAIDGNSGTAVSSLTTGVSSFDVISATGTGLNCTAGTIRIIDPHHSSIAVSGPKAVSISYGTTAPTAYQFSGTHTFEFGNGSSTTGGNADGFVIDNLSGTIRVPFQNVIVNSGATTNRWVSTAFTTANGTYIKGNLTVNTTCEFRNLSSAQFAIEGNIANAGIVTSTNTITFASTPIAGGTVVAATTAQTVTGAGVFRNSTTSVTAKFTNLLFNNSTAGSAVTFSIGDVTTTGLNTFTAGIVDIGNNNNYTFGSAGTTARTSGYVLIQGTGEMRKDFATGASSFVFNVGENTGTTEYSPCFLNFSANSIARTIGVKAIDANHPNLNTGSTPLDYLSRYWSFTDNQAGTYTYTGTFTYVAGVGDVNGTEANIKVGRWGGSAWTGHVSTIASPILTIPFALNQTTGLLNGNDFTGRTVSNIIDYTWTGTVNTDWGTDGNWDIAGFPNAINHNVIINTAGGNQPIVATGTSYATRTILVNNTTASLTLNGTATLTASDSVTVTAGAVTLNGTSTLTLNGALTVAPGSTFTLENSLLPTLTPPTPSGSSANLIQGGTTNMNSGAIVVKRYSSALKRLDYTLWSSPVAGQKLLAFSPGTLSTRFYTYATTATPTNNVYVVVPSPSTTDFATGKGYLIRTPNTHPITATNWNGVFTGVPNNGNYSYALDNTAVGQRYNLVGNPYPSPLNAVAFVNDNSANITGTLYFWRKTNNTASPSYCTWTTAGFASNGEMQVMDPNDVIQTGQGFFVEATAAGTSLNFTNSMRIDNHANQFFRSAATVERHRIWLNATNTAGAYSQTMVGYITDATMDVDSKIDGKYLNDGAIAFTSTIGADAYTIQGRSLPFDSADVVPMQFKVTAADTYTIAIDHVDGLFSAGQLIYLRDNLTSIVHDLTAGSYTFTSNAGTFTSRFEVIYQLPLSVANPTFNANQVVIYKNEVNDIVINSGTVIMASVKVFDIRGRLLVESKRINASQTIMNVALTNEVLLVQITSEDGVVVTKKIVR